ncbi:MAG: hypothetical protein GYA21_07050 [Myxococcales bacterium]|nr:hypothetical protein [Myxococcales bacterium]
MNPGAFDEMEALRSLGPADLSAARAEAIGCRCRAELAWRARPSARTARRLLGSLELVVAFAVGLFYLAWGLSCASRVFLDSRLPADRAVPDTGAVLAADDARPAPGAPSSG